MLGDLLGGRGAALAHLLGSTQGTWRMEWEQGPLRHKGLGVSSPFRAPLFPMEDGSGNPGTAHWLGAKVDTWSSIEIKQPGMKSDGGQELASTGGPSVLHWARDRALPMNSWKGACSISSVTSVIFSVILGRVL